MICRICHHDDRTVACGRYRRCRECGGMFLHPFPAREENAVFSGAEAAARLEAEDLARRAFLVRRLEWLRQGLGRDPADAALLEIGCGAGVMLQDAARRGWRVTAVEMSPELADLAAARTPQAEIRRGDVLALDDLPSGCDAVVALDVIEHVTDPARLLQRCRDALAPGGLLLLQTPNTDSLRRRLQGRRWDMLDPEQHLTLFSPRALRMLLDAAGFDLVWLRTISGSGTETGAAAVAARLKERLLDLAGWGNGLAVLARRRG